MTFVHSSFLTFLNKSMHILPFVQIVYRKIFQTVQLREYDSPYLKMDKQLLYMPILPSMPILPLPRKSHSKYALLDTRTLVVGQRFERNIRSNLPMQVTKSRKVPWSGIDKKLHQQGNLFIKMKQGNKNASIVQNWPLICNHSTVLVKGFTISLEVSLQSKLSSLRELRQYWVRTLPH